MVALIYYIGFSLCCLAAVVLTSCQKSELQTSLFAGAETDRDIGPEGHGILLSRNLLSALIPAKVEQEINHEGWRDGVYSWVKGTLKGETKIDLVPVSGKLAIDVLLFARTDLNTTSVVSRNNVQTTFWTNATVSIGSRVGTRLSSDEAPYVVPSKSNAETQLRIRGVRTNRNGLFRNLILERARKEVFASRNKISNSLEQETTSEIAAQLDREALSAVAGESFGRLVAIRDSLVGVPALAERLSLETTADFVRLGVGTLSRMPQVRGAEAADLVARIDAKILSMIASEMVAGKTLKAKELETLLATCLGLAPRGHKDKEVENEAAEALIFADESPFGLTINSEAVVLQLALAGIEAERTYALPVRVEITYTPVDGGLIRDDEILVEPLEEGARLSRKQKILIEELEDAIKARVSRELIPRRVQISGDPAVWVEMRGVALNQGYLDAAWGVQ